MWDIFHPSQPMPGGFPLRVFFHPHPLSACVCVFLSVQAVMFEPIKVGVSFLVHTYIFTISRSSLSTKVIGSKSWSNQKFYNSHNSNVCLYSTKVYLKVKVM